MNHPAANHPITVAIVDDQKVLVEALKMVVDSQPDIQVVGTAASSPACLELVQNTHPTVLLLETSLPDGDGLALLPQIKRLSPDSKVVVLTAQSDEATLLQALDRGASGFVGKNRGLVEVLAAIRAAAAGELAVPVNLLLDLLRRRPGVTSQAAGPDKPTELPKLTRREREILTCLAQGKSGAQIADELDLSPQTIRTFIRNILDKLGVHSRMEAVTFALRRGLIEPPG